MKRIIFSTISLTILLSLSFAQAKVNVDGVIQDKEYTSVYNVDKDFKFHISSDAKNVYVGLESNSKGWVAIGFGSPVMDKSIMFIGYFNKDKNKFEVEQTIGVKHNHPKAEKNEVISSAGKRENNKTTVEFVIPKKIGNLTLQGEVDVIWAYSVSDSIKSYHSKRGATKVKF
ncbi:MAG: DOMON domain-containing protein [Brevinematales bacterium]|nr:DOMON domain-containing protein [Brevinematales bacterium]